MSIEIAASTSSPGCTRKSAEHCSTRGCHRTADASGSSQLIDLVMQGRPNSLYLLRLFLRNGVIKFSTATAKASCAVANAVEDGPELVEFTYLT